MWCSVPAAANSWTPLIYSQNLRNRSDWKLALVRLNPQAFNTHTSIKANSAALKLAPDRQMFHNAFWYGRVSAFRSPLKVRYPNSAASRYIINIPRNDTLATFCIFLLERLQRERKTELLSEVDPFHPDQFYNYFYIKTNV